MSPGQFFVLKFDFSPVNRSPNIDEVDQYLKKNIATSFRTFYKTYSIYLDENADADKLFKNIDPRNPASSLVNCTELVHDVISKARERGEERLAGIQGVSNRAAP